MSQPGGGTLVGEAGSTLAAPRDPPRTPTPSMRFFRPLALLLLLAAALAGCAKQATKIKLGFLVKQPEEPWFQFEWKGADKAAAQSGLEVVKLGVPDGE